MRYQQINEISTQREIIRQSSANLQRRGLFLGAELQSVSLQPCACRKSMLLRVTWSASAPTEAAGLSGEILCVGDCRCEVADVNVLGGVKSWTLEKKKKASH